jgi:hypothetical protein
MIVVVMMMMVVMMMAGVLMCLASVMGPSSDRSKRNTDHNGKSGNNLLQAISPYYNPCEGIFPSYSGLICSKKGLMIKFR